MVHAGGCNPRLKKGLLYPDSCCALPQRLSFFAAGPAAIRRRRGVHTSRGVATEPRAAMAAAVSVRCGRAHAENRPGSRDAASAPGERQPLKLTRYMKSCWRIAAPSGRPLSLCLPGGATGLHRHREPCDRPGSGPPVTWWGPLQGPHHAPEPSPSSLNTETEKHICPKNRTEQNNWSPPGAAVGCDRREYPLSLAQPSGARPALTRWRFGGLWRIRWKTLQK